MADNQPVMSKTQKRKADWIDARNAKKAARKEQKKIERESHDPDWVDPEHTRPPLLAAREIVDWLLAQDEMPHPGGTNRDVMLMWLEAMNAGVSQNYMRRRLPEVMQLWREEGDGVLALTEAEQESELRITGPEMTQPIITISWQQFKQAKDLRREVDEQLSQSLQQAVVEKEVAEDTGN